MSQISLELIQKVLTNTCDIQYRTLQGHLCTAEIIFLRSMCDAKRMARYIIDPLLKELDVLQSAQEVMNGILRVESVHVAADMNDLINNLLDGFVAVLLPHLGQAICCDLKTYETRAVDIPQTETVIKGPREGFTEDIRVNISEIRRRIKTPKLKIERFVMGNESRTNTVMLYIDGCTPQKLVDYVRDKIKQVQNDYVFYPNLLENKMKCKYSPFDTIGYTEKPDVASSKLAEGRVLVLVDGNPFAVTAPMFFIEYFQTTDDYTTNSMMANIGRLFRWIAFFMSTFAPGLYLALVTYHFKLVPTIFLYRLALFRAGVPVPTFVELLYMMFFFQIIREAGVRLPQPIGPTLSIVGALILGEAAVTSGLASQITVVVVAITSIASYLIPVLHAPIFLWSLATVVFSSLIGLPGFYMCFVLFVAHLGGLTSCGYPFLYPFGTAKTFKYHDVFLRGDLSKVSRKPLARNKQT